MTWEARAWAGKEPMQGEGAQLLAHDIRTLRGFRARALARAWPRETTSVVISRLFNEGRYLEPPAWVAVATLSRAELRRA